MFTLAHPETFPRSIRFVKYYSVQFYCSVNVSSASPGCNPVPLWVRNPFRGISIRYLLLESTTIYEFYRSPNDHMQGLKRRRNLFLFYLNLFRICPFSGADINGSPDKLNLNT